MTMAEGDCQDALSQSSFENSDSSDGDWDDYDDVPLTVLSSKPATTQGLPGFAALSLPRAQAPVTGTTPPRLPQPSNGAVPSTSLATPDPCEPLPTSRTARRSVVTPLRLQTETAPSQQQGPGASVPSLAMPKLNIPLALAKTDATAMQPLETARNPTERARSGSIQSQSSSQSATSTVAPNFIQVSLLSSAFCITNSIPDSQGLVTEAVKQQVMKRCVQELGVEQQMVQLYQVQDLQPNANTPPIVHVAAHISNSTFSLAALEEQIKATKDLQDQQAANAKTINSMVSESQALHKENKLLAVDNARQAEQLKAEQAKNASLQEEIMRLRSQLHGVEDQRSRLQTTIKDLKKEFQRTISNNMFATPTAPVPGNV